MFCTECGVGVESKAKFCTNCGQSVGDGYIAVESNVEEGDFIFGNKIAKGELAINEKFINSVLFDAFVEKNITYYKDKLLKIYPFALEPERQKFLSSNQKLKSSKNLFGVSDFKNMFSQWNWMAAFGGAFWCAYRKMYWEALTLFVIMEVLLFFVDSRYMWLGIFFTCGFYGNYIYLKSLDRKIKNSNSVVEFMPKCGVNYIYPVILLLVSILTGYYHFDKNSAKEGAECLEILQKGGSGIDYAICKNRHTNTNTNTNIKANDDSAKRSAVNLSAVKNDFNMRPGIKYDFYKSGQCVAPESGTACLSEEDYKKLCTMASTVVPQAIQEISILAGPPEAAILTGGNITSVKIGLAKSGSGKEHCYVILSAQGIYQGSSKGIQVQGIVESFMVNDLGKILVRSFIPLF